MTMTEKRERRIDCVRKRGRNEIALFHGAQRKNESS
jgi:hypothetical protein